jgi:hypothetical protein
MIIYQVFIPYDSGVKIKTQSNRIQDELSSALATKKTNTQQQSQGIS